MTDQIPTVLTESIKHHIGADCYIREAIIPKNYFVIKHKHTYDHFSILGSGSVSVLVAGIETTYVAPACIKISAEVEHEIRALEDSTWFCIHGTIDEILDLNKVEIKGVR